MPEKQYKIYVKWFPYESEEPFHDLPYNDKKVAEVKCDFLNKNTVDVQFVVREENAAETV